MIIFVAEAGARTGPGAAATIIGRPGARAVKRGTAPHDYLLSALYCIHSIIEAYSFMRLSEPDELPGGQRDGEEELPANYSVDSDV